MKSSRRVRVALLTAALSLMTTASAAAAGGAAGVGKKLGGILLQWGGALFVGLVAIVALPHLTKRDVGGGLVFGVLALVIGLFVFAGQDIAHFVKTFGHDVLR